MDKREAIIAAQQYVNGIEKKYNVVRALVFGSYAKGNYHANSDIDLALVLTSVDNIFDTQVDLMQLRSDDSLQIEPHTFRLADFDTDDPLVYEIVTSGIELKTAAMNKA